MINDIYFINQSIHQFIKSNSLIIWIGFLLQFKINNLLMNLVKFFASFDGWYEFLSYSFLQFIFSGILTKIWNNNSDI